MDSPQKVKWEELEGGIVTSPKLEQNPGKIDAKTTRNKMTEQHHGVHNFLASGSKDIKRNSVDPRPPPMDKSTCVSSKASGTNGLEDHWSALRPGTNLTIDITIICKASSNTLYISAKLKGREYHGVLTDGEPLFANLYTQKRYVAHNAENSVLGSSGNNSTNSASKNGASGGQNAEKTSGSGLVWKRGGKRGGGHAKSGIEKRIKNQDSTGTADVGEPKNQNINKSESIEDSSSAAGHTEPIKPATTDKSLLHPQSSAHHHPHEQRRRRTSSSTFAHSSLQDNDALARVRCPHVQCGHRYGTVNELNTHLIFGPHGVAETKAKIFESSATQTTPVKYGADHVTSAVNQPNEVGEENSGPLPLCSKCNSQLVNNLKPDPSMIPAIDDKIKQQKGGSGSENSPSFSDISDDAAPTLEKEEVSIFSFDKQGEEASAVRKGIASSTRFDASTTVAGPSEEVPPISPTCSTSKHSDETIPSTMTTAPPPKCVSPHIQQQVPQSDANAGFGVPNLVEQPVQNAMLMVGNIPMLMNATASTTTSSATEAVITAAGPPSYLATTPSVGSSATPFQLNPMLSFGTQLTHAYASALAQAQCAADGIASSSTTATNSVEPPKFMSPPSGLLSLGTPLCSVASTSSRTTATVPSRSAPFSAASNPMQQHKIYELQQQQQQQASSSSSSPIGRASSTKASMSAGDGGGGGPSKGWNSSADLASLMRPNSTISAIGHHQQQQQRNQQSHLNAGQLPQHQQQNRSLPLPGSHTLPPLPTNQPFFPSLPPSMFGGVPPNILAMQQQQQQFVPNMGQLRPNVVGGQNNNAYATTDQQQQQQMASTIQQPPTAASIPAELAAALAASNFDLNLLHQYAALLASTSSSANSTDLGAAANGQPSSSNRK